MWGKGPNAGRKSCTRSARRNSARTSLSPRLVDYDSGVHSKLRVQCPFRSLCKMSCAVGCDSDEILRGHDPIHGLVEAGVDEVMVGHGCCEKLKDVNV